jgi:hypothetical protein
LPECRVLKVFRVLAERRGYKAFKGLPERKGFKGRRESKVLRGRKALKARRTRKDFLGFKVLRFGQFKGLLQHSQKEPLYPFKVSKYLDWQQAPHINLKLVLGRKGRPEHRESNGGSSVPKAGFTTVLVLGTPLSVLPVLRRRWWQRI